MAATRETLERQVARAKDKLAQKVKVMDENGVAEKTRRRDPVWRELNADCRQLGRRLRAFDKVVALDAELKERKTRALEAGDEAEVEEVKPAKAEKKAPKAAKSEKSADKKPAKAGSKK